MTASSQMYLQAIYMLELERKKVRVVDIANTLSVTKASVSGALSRLNRDGYINHERYGDVTLTLKGFEKSKMLLARWQPSGVTAAL